MAKRRAEATACALWTASVDLQYNCRMRSLTLLAFAVVCAVSCRTACDECGDEDASYCEGNVLWTCGFEYSDSSAPRVWTPTDCELEGNVCRGPDAHIDHAWCVLSGEPDPRCEQSPICSRTADSTLAFAELGDTVTTCKGDYPWREVQQRCGFPCEEPGTAFCRDRARIQCEQNSDGQGVWSVWSCSEHEFCVEANETFDEPTCVLSDVPIQACARGVAVSNADLPIGLRNRADAGEWAVTVACRERPELQQWNDCLYCVDSYLLESDLCDCVPDG